MGIEGPVVFIVDNHADTLELCAAVSQMARWTVRTPADGATALALATADASPDRLIAGLRLPEMETLDVIARLRRCWERACRRSSSRAGSATGPASASRGMHRSAVEAVPARSTRGDWEGAAAPTRPW
jgi:hypothetical protein